MEEFEFGDIIDGEMTNHPIIFFSKKNDDEFYGCIITHSGNFDNNFALKKEHFIENDERGMHFQIQFENSFIAKLKLEKQNNWGPFQKKGALSESGKKFVKDKVQNEQPIKWNEYIESLRLN